MPPAGSLTAEQLSFFDANGEPPHSLTLPATGGEVIHGLARLVRSQRRSALTEEISTYTPNLNLVRDLFDRFLTGYLVLEPFSGEEDVRALRDRMAELIAGLDDAAQHHVRRRSSSILILLPVSFPNTKFCACMTVEYTDLRAAFKIALLNLSSR